MNQQDLRIVDHASFEKARSGKDPAWMGALRVAAMERFASMGFPTTRDEDWKYTNVATLAGGSFRTLVEHDPAPDLDLSELGINSWSGARLVFINGTYAPNLSVTDGLPDGVYAGGLAEAVASVPERIEKYLGRYARRNEQAFGALNTAFLRDGVFLEIPDDARVELPIQLLFVATANGEPFVTHPRNLIVVGRHSEVTLYESYVSASEEAYWTNSVTEIVAAEGARIQHIRVQEEGPAGHHIATVQVHLERDAGYTSHSISLGGALVRNDLNVLLAAEGSECSLNGLYLAGDKEHVDNHTIVDHAQPHATSRELYKGILADQAHGVFNGRVIVREKAQKTDAKQSNKNLLLSRDAMVHTKPQLEIFANDVKCAHGATIGQLDRDALFYLRTRGLGYEQARRLLIQAFASELVDAVPSEPVRAILAEALERRLTAFHSEEAS